MVYLQQTCNWYETRQQTKWLGCAHNDRIMPQQSTATAKHEQQKPLQSWADFMQMYIDVKTNGKAENGGYLTPLQITIVLYIWSVLYILCFIHTNVCLKMYIFHNDIFLPLSSFASMKD